MVSLEELNRHLERECERDMDEQARPHGPTRRELLTAEQERMLPLPAAPFAACRQESTFATKQALVRFDTNDYSVPVRWAYHQVVIKGFVDRVELYAGDERAAMHARSYGAGEFILDPYHYIPLLETKPGGIHNARAFKGEPWGEDFARMRRELEYRYGGEGTRKFVEVLLLFTEFPVGEVKRAVRQCVRRRAFSEEAVLATLTYRPRRKLPRLDLAGRALLACVSAEVRPARVYDALLSGKGGRS